MKLLLAAFALVAVPVMAAEPTLYGRYEYIQLPEIGQTFKAKMDTGALTGERRPGSVWMAVVALVFCALLGLSGNAKSA